MCDSILIDKLKIYAYHGVLPEEKEKGQYFYVSAELFLDLQAAGLGDDLYQTINYAEVCDLITSEATKEKYDLIETLAERTAFCILNAYERVNSVRIEVFKPEAPIEKDFENISVRIHRKRHTVYLGLGSNIGNGEETINKGLEMLSNVNGCSITAVSSFVKSTPYGVEDQPDFTNAVACISTYLNPYELLHTLNDIELKNNRVRELHWGPRTLDMDILLYDDLVMSKENLIIPHIDMLNRDFVLKPLCEIAPTLRYPINGRLISDLAKDVCEKHLF